MKKAVFKIVPVLIMVTFFMTGCNQSTMTGTEKAVKPVMKAAQNQKANVLKGKIVGKSNKAKTISISVQ